MGGECCPRFDAGPWDDTLVTWENKRFVKDRVTSFFHIPLNFGAVMRRNLAAIEAAGALSDKRIVLADEGSRWGADVYIEAAADVPGARMATLSGTFLSKVFEGPYRDVGRWIEEMKSALAARGKPLGKIYFYYATCPKCAEKYGKNYVVLLTQL